MGPWLVCACCSSGRSRKQQYRYEVVYRREESLYSGPDYLESLPGGRKQLPQTGELRSRLLPSAPSERPREILPLPSPTSRDTINRQNQVNNRILSGVRGTNNAVGLRQQFTPPFAAPTLVSPSHHRIRFPLASRGPPTSNWRSVGHLQEAPPVRFVAPGVLQASKSAPLLALHDASICSRDHSRDTSRDQSLASSTAPSTRTLLPPTRGKRPPPLVLVPQQHSNRPQILPGLVAPPRLSGPRFGGCLPPLHPHLGPRSPHTPLSPGPPAYPGPYLRLPSQQTILPTPPGSVTRDLRQYLNTRYPKGGVDHDLQNTIRDNVYLRTVPVTTRTPRPGEHNGLDYTFLSQQEFDALRRSGNLLESGVFQGNHYGTPKPPAQPPTVEGRGTNSGAAILPGAHPSSEGKRRRNRSNVEAMASNMTEPQHNQHLPHNHPALSQHGHPSPSQHGYPNPPQHVHPSPPQHIQPPNHMPPPGHEMNNMPPHQTEVYNNPPADPENHHNNDISVDGVPDGVDLGPLPPNWEQAFTEKGEPYFIDMLAGTSSWLDPRLAKVQKQKAEECGEDELPYGWERIDDPQYGTYYIDHVNRLTQYENPVTMAKTQPADQQEMNGAPVEDPMSNTFPRQKKMSPDGAPGQMAEPPTHHNNLPVVAPKRNSSTWNSTNNTTHESVQPPTAFTRNPAELRGEFLRTQLIKSSRGLGFTIVGGDDTKEEFLQIKSVVPNGPAWQDGNLRTGDVLVYVNETCVLGYTHADVVNIFQNIEPGRSVFLEVCRGYPLPFDPNDPNTEIVTTVAVTTMDSRSAKSMFGESYERSRHNSSESLNTAKSMPDLSNPDRVQQVPRPGSADLLSSENYDPAPDILDFYNPNMSKPEYLTIHIVKGNMGFGFTIADSQYGQKVKKILDRSRCKNLMEGDILVDINNINVKRMSHTEVVQVLKDCSHGQEAIVMVERGGANSPSKNRPRKEPLPSPKKAILGPSSAGSAFSSSQYRSKTPTADMYSSQTKEIIPNRPKTPLVDTRTRSKTPTVMPDPVSYSGPEMMPPGPDVNAMEHRVPDPTASHYPENPPQVPPHQHPPQDLHYDPKGVTLAQQMSRVAIDTNNYGYFNNEANRSSGGIEYNSFPSNGSMPQTYNYQNNTSYPSDSGYQQQNSESYEYDMKRNLPKTPVQDYNTNPSFTNSQQFNYYTANNSGPHNGNLSSNTGSTVNNNNNGHNTSLDNNPPTGGYGYMSYPKDSFDVPRQDSGYSSQTQIPPARNPYPSYYNPADPYNNSPNSYNYPNDNSLSRRKESTSFEHEHPAPVSIPRLPDGRYAGGQQRPTRGAAPNGGAAPHEFTVTLRRQETGFGFRIVGGTEDGSQVSIGHIVSGGAADQDGTVLTGDEILAVNGDTVVGASHHKVVTLMATSAARGVVTLTLCRRTDVHNRSMDTSFPYDVTVTRREKEGFGFVIISPPVAKNGSIIGRIVPFSPAERCGKLFLGDRILAVNGVDIKSLHHGNIVNLIKLSGYSVTLTIGAPRDDLSCSTNSQKADSDVGDDAGEYLNVELQRGARGFGFSIRGGREFGNMPLFVLRIAEGGPAHHDTKLRVGDHLIEINGQSTKGMTHADAIELIKQSNTTVSLLVMRGGRVPQQMPELMNAGNVVSPVGPPPPNTNIRSTVTLPPPQPQPQPSPGHNPSYPPPPPPPHQYPPHNSYPPPVNHINPPQHYPHNGSVRPQPPLPLHSSPGLQSYPSPLTPNGPLGQSSPRVMATENYWNRMQQ